MNNDNLDELYISYFFPPDNQVSGINVYKRIVENKRKIDVLHGYNNSSINSDIFNQYINNQITVDINGNYDWVDFIFEFIKQGLNSITHDYKKIYSRSWLMANHFLAAEYKFKNTDCFWTAEFSDPLIYDITNKIKNYKEMIINNKVYIDEINAEIINYNKKHNTSFDLIKNKTSAYYIAEYLVYIFADKIVFTNYNQSIVMLDQFPQDIKEYILNKIEIKPHSTLPDEYYHLKNVNLNLNENYINMAYFGSDYYSLRHFESLFYAADSINHNNNVKIYLFLNDEKLIKNLINTLKLPDSFIIKKPLSYFEFLNATTQYDVLIVNDLITKDNFKLNPYLPSKLSDYLGSKTDIWALYEKESVLSKYDLKYMSDIHNLNECRSEFIKILNDKSQCVKYNVDEDYLFKRLTKLNQLYENEFRKNEKLKKENNEILSSNSWKITKPLRKLRK